MKKLLRAIMILIFCGTVTLAVLIATGVTTLEDTLSLLGRVRDRTSQIAIDQGTLIVSQLADHKPPEGEGQVLEGELPEDRLPDAEALYSFSDRLYPYQAMLTDAERSAYYQVYANAVELYDEIPLHTPISMDSIGRVMSAVFYDHPGLFWLDTSYRYSYNSQNQVVAVDLQFNETAADIDAHRTRFESVVRLVIEQARTLPTAVEQEKYVHDYLLDHVAYRLDSPLNQSAYSALVYGESVCAGYARAFQYILLELGIPCYYCAGYAGENHAWNIVGLEDGYYHVDVAWDDPLGNEVGRYYYNYFNITDEKISADHTRTGLSEGLPPCTATGYSYANAFGTGDEADVPTYRSSLLTAEEAGFREQDAISTLGDYYTACSRRLQALGTGTHTITLLIANQDLLEQILQLTESGEALGNYVTPAAESLGLGGYSSRVSLQAEALEGGYWLLTQQVQLEGQAQREPAPAREPSSSTPEPQYEPAPSSAPEFSATPDPPELPEEPLFEPPAFDPEDDAPRDISDQTASEAV